MSIHPVLRALLLAGTATLGACASQAPSTSYIAQSSEPNRNYGVIDSIQVVRPGGSSGAGAVVGGVIGALAGNQIGGGAGRAAATVAGAVGGAVIGNNVENNRNAQAADRYQIAVRLDSGDMTTLVQDSAVDLHLGDRVHVVDGRVYRY